MVTTEKSQLRIGYAGPLEEERATAFATFLREHFADVTLLPVADIRSSAKDVDVLIVDNTGGEGRHPINNDAGRGNMVVPQVATDHLPTPTVFVGGLANWLASQASLMVGQGCIKLALPALTPSLDHPIFAGIEGAAQTVPVRDCLPMIGTKGPDGELRSRVFPDPDGTAFQIDVTTPWPGDPEEAKARLRGLVTSAPVGAPDFEWICGGLQNDAPDGATICRQARFLSWGFSEPPTNMTEAGRAMFVNAVKYIAGFAGEEPITFRVATSRKSVLALREQADPSFGLPGLPPGVEVPPQLRQQLTAMSRNGLIKEFGDEESAEIMLGEAWQPWWEEREPYLRWVGPQHGGRFVVDDDAKALGIKLDDPAILERCVADLEVGTETDRALRLLQRLTLLDLGDAADWRAWLDAHRDELAFVHSAGYRYLWPGAPAYRPFQDAPQRPVDQLIDVSGSFQVVNQPRSEEPGDVNAVLMAQLSCLVAPGHEIFVTEGTPLSIGDVEGSDFEPVGIQGPAPLDGRLGGHFYLRVALKGEGRRAVLKLAYQTWSPAGEGAVRELVLPPLVLEQPMRSEGFEPPKEEAEPTPA